MLRVVESYFDALTSHDRTVALAHEGCGRAENGSPAPGGAFLPPANPGGAPTGPGAAADGPIRDCLAGLENFNLSMVVARRVPLIDVEAQVALSFAVFIRRPGSPTPRNVFSEWFVIDDAKIRTIYTAMFYPPPELAVPNWPPFDGNWPLPAGVGAAALAQPANLLTRSQDRAEIQELVNRYVTALDTRDADMYANVFTEDAVYELPGSVYEGRAAIRKIVTDLQEAQARAEAEGRASPALYHVMSNSSIELIDEDEARHTSYAQTVRAADGGQFVVGFMGRYEDVIIKREGRWQIQSRRLVSFVR